ncbi:MAG: NAD(P)-dependent oxidoreductase [Faecalibacterium sp.]
MCETEQQTSTQPKIFAVAQTDARQAAAGRALAAKGYTVVGAEETALADYILLPLPLDDEQAGLAQLLRAAKPEAIAFGGKISPKVQAMAAASRIELLDYFARPELAILNAIPTAEGAIALLFAHRSSTLWGAELLVTGFGRVAQSLASRLLALGAKVTIAARSAEQRAMARAMGCEAVAIESLRQCAAQFTTAINTVPALLLDATVLGQMPQGSLVIDLASRPGGVDFAAAKALGMQAIHALSLPAACAPESAGAFVAQTVLEMIAERRNTE